MPRKSWTKTEVMYLKAHCEYETNAEIAKALRRTVQSVREKRRKVVAADRFKWDEEKLEYLKANYDKMFTKDLARHIGCHRTTVRIMARRLGMYKPDDFNKSTAKARGERIRTAFEIRGMHHAGQFQKGNDSGIKYQKGRKVPKEEIAKRLVTWHETRRREKLRVKGGLKQLTKMRL